MTTSDETSVVVPGERIGRLDQFSAGSGTYIRHGFVHSCLVGHKHVLETSDGELSLLQLPVLIYLVMVFGKNTRFPKHFCDFSKLVDLVDHWVLKLPVITVVREDVQHAVPEVGSIVTCKVTSTNPRFCKVAIIGVESTPLKETFRGTVRKEDVRATEKDKVEMYKSFRPGDILLARVTSLQTQSYFLTTADNELGVIFAKSESGGAAMVPISWCKMQCPKTNAVEFRKVAKVQQAINEI